MSETDTIVAAFVSEWVDRQQSITTATARLIPLVNTSQALELAAGIGDIVADLQRLQDRLLQRADAACGERPAS